ncbi:MAG: hypothetical protein ABI947_14745 [Chloroflexota bacterium]
MRSLWRVLYGTCLIVLVLCGDPTRMFAQSSVTGPFDVFVNHNISKNQAGLFFVDSRTGLSNVVVTNGTRHTLLGNGVLYLENDTKAIKIAYPNGRTDPFPAIEVNNAKAQVDWVVSPNGKQIAWTVSLAGEQSLLSDLFVAGADGSAKKLVLHTSSTKGVDTIPLAVTDDGTQVFYARQTRDPQAYQLFATASDVFSVDIASGQPTELPGKTECLCALGFAANGHPFVRLQPAGDSGGFDALILDPSIKLETQISAPQLTHRQAGNLLMSRDGGTIIYTSARGVPPAKGVPPEQYAVIVADVSRREQHVVVAPQKINLRPIAFEHGNTVAILVNADGDGTYKLSLKDGNLLPVSAYTFLGTISN